MKLDTLKSVLHKSNTKEKFLLGTILRECYGNGLRVEYRFCPTRRFRADYFIPRLNLLVEYEGVFGGKSRHTNVCGYSADCEKYNLATVLGYRVLRYTAKNYAQVQGDLDELEQYLKVGGSV